VLSLFPALLAMVSLLGIVGQADETTAALLGILRGIAPGSTVNLIRGPIEEPTTSQTAGFTLATGIVGAFWTASGYVSAFARAMNRIYEVDEGRSSIRFRATMLGVTILAVVIVAMLAALLVLSGPVAEAMGRLLGLGGLFLTVWNIAKWPVIILLVIVIVAVLYYVTPNVHQPRFRWLSPGSFLALVAFVLASVVFSAYVANFGNYNKTYSAIGGVIIMLLWLWILNVSLLFGAEFDAETERGRELQGGFKAEVTIQLPPRDTKKSDKLHRQEEEEIRRGRKIRERISSREGLAADRS
jgi:membrane protein